VKGSSYDRIRANARLHVDGVKLEEADRARLRTYCLARPMRGATGAATLLGTSPETIGKLLDGFGAKAASVAQILSRLP
jgi:hypothetical protein